MKGLNIHHKYITPYHPQCNGLNEKFNGELKLMMTKMIHGKEKNWDLELNSAVGLQDCNEAQYTIFTLSAGIWEASNVTFGCGDTNTKAFG